MKTSTLGIEISFLENEAKRTRLYEVGKRTFSPRAPPDSLCMDRQTAGVIFEIVSLQVSG